MRKEDSFLFIQNQQIYQYYYDRLISMALAQFEWHGLPDSVDRQYMERTLLFKGAAAWYIPEGTDFWVCTDFIPRNTPNGMYDIYGYPRGIEGIGFNAEHIETSEFRILYDNTLLTGNTGTTCSLVGKMQLYAQLLWEIHQTIRQNLQQQNTPYIVTTNKSKLLSVRNFFNHVRGYDPVIEVTKGFEDDDIKTLDLKVDFKGNDLYQLLKSVWADALALLGISAETTKKERLLNNEITLNRQEDLIALNARLLNRVDFCNYMNKTYGMNLSVNISSEDFSFKAYGEEGEENGDLYSDLENYSGSERP